MSVPRRVAALVAVAWYAVGATAGEAQTIRGTFRERAPDAGLRVLGGAFVSLLSAGDDVVDSGFTMAGGEYVLHAGAPGRYRVRVQRIGVETWESDPVELAAGADLRRDWEVPVRPIRLSDLAVSVARYCVSDDDRRASGDIETAWEEARKALETTAWAEARGELRFVVVRYAKLQDPETLGTRDSEARRDTVAPPPFASFAPAVLERKGYVSRAEDGLYFSAPDAEALLSDGFRRSHCFALSRTERDGRPLLGLEFEPSPERSVPDIRGTIWLDEATADLVALEYRYDRVDLPAGSDPRRVGGRIAFARLPGGPFFVRDWWIRVPLRLGTVTSVRREARFGADPGVGRLAGYREEGGEVTDVIRNGRPLDDIDGGRIVGSVLDGVRGAPLAGAEVTLEGTGLQAITGPRGRFSLRGVPPGEHRASVRHPLLPALDATLTGRVDVEEGEQSELEIRGPDAESTFRRVCPTADPLENVGAVVGVVRRSEDGAAAVGVRVTLSWEELHVEMAGDAAEPRLVRRPRRLEAVSDDRGVFRFCGPPGAHRMHVRVTAPDRPPASETFEMRTRVIPLDLVLAPPEGN